MARVTWKILKYYEPVLLPNTKCRSCYYLFIIEAEKVSVTHKRPFFLRLKNRKHILRFCPTNCNFSADYWCFLIEFLLLLKTGLPVNSVSILTNNIITITLTLMTIYLHGFRF